MKHAILILAHKNYNQLYDLISFFALQCDVFIHIDKKSSITPKEQNQLAQLSNVTKVYRKYSVHWAGFSILKCELFLLKQAIENSDADYFHLISAQDYPIKSLDYFLSFFEQHKGKEFLDFKNLPSQDWENNSFRRFQYFIPNDWVNARSKKGKHIIDTFIKWQKKLGYKRRVPDQFEHLFGGSAWFSITRRGSNVLINYTQKHPAFYRRMKYTYVPEETYVPTVLVNLIPAGCIHNNNYRFVRWRHENKSFPANLSEKHFYKLAASDAIFARKLEYPHCERLIPLINKYLLQHKPLTITETGSWVNQTFSEYTFDYSLSKALLRLCRLMEIKSAVDLGCGAGLYVTALRKKMIPIVGYDGNPYTAKLSSLLLGNNHPCDIADLTEKLKSDDPFDLVLCLDVCHYIPTEHEKRVIENLTNNSSKYIILSWGTPEKKKIGYINTHTNEYVIQKFKEHKFTENILAKNYLREQARIPWLKNSLFVFQRETSKQ